MANPRDVNVAHAPIVSDPDRRVESLFSVSSRLMDAHTRDQSASDMALTPAAPSVADQIQFTVPTKSLGSLSLRGKLNIGWILNMLKAEADGSNDVHIGDPHPGS